MTASGSTTSIITEHRVNAVRLGVALGGGAVRGAAHIGVLKALQEAQVQIHYLAGTSAGALIGALFALHQDWRVIERLRAEVRWRDLMRTSLFSRRRWHRQVAAVLERTIGDTRFEDLRTNLSVTAVDLKTGQLIVFRHGPLLPAIQASISMPEHFVPLAHNGRLLVDGGILCNVPAQIVRDMGADVVLTVDVRNQSEWPVRRKIRHADLRRRTYEIMRDSLAEQVLQGADFVVRPSVGQIDAFDFRQLRHCVQAGETAARETLARLVERVQEQGALRG